MKEKLKRWLQKRPFWYRAILKIYGHSNIYVMAEHFVGTQAREKEWTTRHRRKGNDWNSQEHRGENEEWVLSYWDSRNHSHRGLLLEKIADFSPVSSVLEIGCNCGPNLYLIAQKFPGIEIKGIDINPVAIEKGKQLFHQADLPNVKLSVAKADDLSQFRDKSFDIVFTDAVLIYIGPDKIGQVIKEMLRVARKALVLLEKHSAKDRAGLGFRPNSSWHRNYIALLEPFVPEERIRITRITKDIWSDPEWQENGAIIEVALE